MAAVSRTNGWKKSINRSKYLLLMVSLGLVWYAVFCYVPMYGIQIAFRDYSFNKGIWGSPLIGFENFRRMFALNDFWDSVRNTLLISLGRLLFEFPLPILLAILLNELKNEKIKRLYQTVYTFPNFISWVIAYSLFSSIFSGEGLVNLTLARIGIGSSDFFANSVSFIVLIFTSSAWKTMGWSAIIYCAAIAGINPEIYEAAVVDGANRFQRIRFITIPELIPTIVTLLILTVGGCMNAGFDQIFNFYNPLVYKVADIIDTYVYRMSFQGGTGFSFSTAVGLFKSVISFLLILGADRLAKSVGQNGII